MLCRKRGKVYLTTGLLFVLFIISSKEKIGFNILSPSYNNTGYKLHDAVGLGSKTKSAGNKSDGIEKKNVESLKPDFLLKKELSHQQK